MKKNSICTDFKFLAIYELRFFWNSRRFKLHNEICQLNFDISLNHGHFYFFAIEKLLNTQKKFPKPSLPQFLVENKWKHYPKVKMSHKNSISLDTDSLSSLNPSLPHPLSVPVLQCLNEIFIQFIKYEKKNLNTLIIIEFFLPLDSHHSFSSLHIVFVHKAMRFFSLPNSSHEAHKSQPTKHPALELVKQT